MFQKVHISAIMLFRFMRTPCLKYFFALFVLLFVAGVASAHPMGSSAFGHRMELEVSSDHLELFYVVEMPVAVFVAQSKDDKGEVLGRLARGLKLYVDGSRRGWMKDSSFVEDFGKGDQNFFEYRLKLISRLPSNKDGMRYKVEVVNENFEESEGVFRDSVLAKAGIHVEDVNLPEDMSWSSDYSFRKIKVTFEIDGDEKHVHRYGAGTGGGESGCDDGKLTSFLREKNLGLSVVLLALGTAFLLGALHAMAPGHGKALISAYLVGSKGSYPHAFLLGLVVTIAHTGSVFLLGFVFWLLADKIYPEQITPYIGLVSGVVISLIGLFMLFKRWRDYSGCGHCHHTHTAETSFKSLMLLGISGGVAPCPTGLALMLVAISIDRALWGLALVTAFSLGLAAVLVVLGVVSISATNLFRKISSSGKVWKMLPIISSIVVIVVGIVLAISSLGLF